MLRKGAGSCAMTPRRYINKICLITWKENTLYDQSPCSLANIISMDIFVQCDQLLIPQKILKLYTIYKVSICTWNV